MGDGRIGVGIIGISPDPLKSWATRAHVPALAHLDEYRLAGVCTSNQASTDAAARHFGVDLAFDDAAALAAHADIDLVVVAVRVPLHRQMVETIARAGKAVFCEWPLGVGLDEAREIRDMAAHVPSIIGLQGSCNETLNYIRDLIADGFIGRMTAVTVHAQAEFFGPRQAQKYAYLIDQGSGANLLTVGAGHGLAALCHTVGDFTSLSAVVSTQYPVATIVETGEEIAKTSPDQILIAGTLANGAVASVHFKGGATRTAGNRIEINGTEGDLVLESSGGANIQRALMTIRGGRGDMLEPMALPARYHLDPPGLPEGDGRAVAHIYQQFACARRLGSPFPLDFDYAVRFHSLLDAIERASASGMRETLA